MCLAIFIDYLSHNRLTEPKNKLAGMLVTLFDGSPYEAINTTYPNKFKKQDFKNYN